MAIATATITVKARLQGGNDLTRSQQVLTGTIAISTGGTYPPGGFPLNWSNLPELSTVPQGNQFQASTGTIMPADMDVKSVANPPSGYIYAWDNVNGNLHIFVSADASSNSSGPLQELGGAISNAIVTDTIQFKAWFVRE
jgi:hypothetical protein